MLILLAFIANFIVQTEHMENTVQSTQKGLREYLLIARPDAAVYEKVLAETADFHTRYKQQDKAGSQPYIAVASFQAKDVMEETIIRYTQRICSVKASFTVELNNYSGYPPHTVYLRVQNPQPFRELAQDLKVINNYVTSCACPPASLVAHPSIAIARQLTETVYLNALMDYSQRTFHETFMVNELVLLRRNHEYDTCKTVHVFRLQPPGYQPFTHTQYN